MSKNKGCFGGGKSNGTVAVKRFVSPDGRLMQDVSVEFIPGESEHDFLNRVSRIMASLGIHPKELVAVSGPCNCGCLEQHEEMCNAQAN